MKCTEVNKGELQNPRFFEHSKKCWMRGKTVWFIADRYPEVKGFEVGTARVKEQVGKEITKEEFDLAIGD